MIYCSTLVKLLLCQNCYVKLERGNEEDGGGRASCRESVIEVASKPIKMLAINAQRFPRIL